MLNGCISSVETCHPNDGFRRASRGPRDDRRLARRGNDRIDVPLLPFVVQTTVMIGGSARCTTTRGGCSPFRRASPSWSLTRTGDPNVRPPSRLTARKMSVAPSGSDALHLIATNAPSAAIDGVAFVRPGTAKVVASASAIRIPIEPPAASAACRRLRSPDGTPPTAWRRCRSCCSR